MGTFSVIDNHGTSGSADDHAQPLSIYRKFEGLPAKKELFKITGVMKYKVEETISWITGHKLDALALHNHLSLILTTI